MILRFIQVLIWQSLKCFFVLKSQEAEPSNRINIMQCLKSKATEDNFEKFVEIAVKIERKLKLISLELISTLFPPHILRLKYR